MDRVRVQDTTYEFGGPGRGSGWRQRSLSNIDLTSQSRHSFTKQIRDYSSGLYDLYSRIESRKDYQPDSNAGNYTAVGGGGSGSARGGKSNGCNSTAANDKRTRHEGKAIYHIQRIPTLLRANPFQSAEKVGNLIYEHIVPTSIDPTCVLGAADSCSLRRTRSLAVIREETYNDLQISGVRTRRSQLIPRAKLCNSSFFKNRYTLPHAQVDYYQCMTLTWPYGCQSESSRLLRACASEQLIATSSAINFCVCQSICRGYELYIQLNVYMFHNKCR